MPEEESDVKVGVVQWRVMSCQGLHHLLRITHYLFTKVCEGIFGRVCYRRNFCVSKMTGVIFGTDLAWGLKDYRCTTEYYIMV